MLCGQLLISTHALREEGDLHIQAFYRNLQEISTHALREEGDQRGIFFPYALTGISTHALREEGDRRTPSLCRRFPYFYPRPP